MTYDKKNDKTTSYRYIELYSPSSWLALQYFRSIKNKAPSKRTQYCWPTTQGHPMDLFLKISVLQAHFCWLGDVEEIIVLGKKVLLGKR